MIARRLSSRIRAKSRKKMDRPSSAPPNNPLQTTCNCPKGKEKKKDKCQVVKSLKRRLDESYGIQKKLSAENEELEQARYTIQERLLEKDESNENLRRKLLQAQNEIQCLQMENESLNMKVESVVEQENKLKELQNELMGLHRQFLELQDDREKLESEKNLLLCSLDNCSAINPDGCEKPNTCQKMKAMNEKLQRGMMLRTNELVTLQKKHEDLKKTSEDLEYQLGIANDTVKRLQGEDSPGESRCACQTGVENGRSLANVETELEQLRSVHRKQSAQLDEYKMKYLAAEQRAEKQAKQIDMLMQENCRKTQEFNSDIQKVKKKFESRLADMSPLLGLLKATQGTLQEAQQVRKGAEHRCEELTHQLNEARAQLGLPEGVEAVSKERKELLDLIETWEKKYRDLQKEHCKLRSENDRIRNQFGLSREDETPQASQPRGSKCQCVPPDGI